MSLAYYTAGDRPKILLFIVFLWIAIMGSSSSAAVLDWGTGAGQANWNPTGPLSQTFTVSGVNVTVALSGDTGNFITWSGVDSPDNSNIVDGGTGGEALYLGVDHANLTQRIIVTVTFSQLVVINSLAIFDIDTFNTNSFQDQIRTISASNGTSTFNATIAADPSFVTVAGSGTAGATLTGILGAGGADGAGNTTSEGTGTISFGSNAINSFTFTYGNGSGSQANPTSQHVALGDITFTIPEPSTYLSAAFLILGLGMHGWRKRCAKKNFSA
jgi:hypothetical protein